MHFAGRGIPVDGLLSKTMLPVLMFSWNIIAVFRINVYFTCMEIPRKPVTIIFENNIVPCCKIANFQCCIKR